MKLLHCQVLKSKYDLIVTIGNQRFFERSRRYLFM